MTEPLDEFEIATEKEADIEFVRIDMPTDAGEILHNNGLQFRRQAFLDGCDWARTYFEGELAKRDEVIGELSVALAYWANETEWMNVPAEFQVKRARNAIASAKAKLKGSDR